MAKQETYNTVAMVKAATLVMAENMGTGYGAMTSLEKRVKVLVAKVIINAKRGLPIEGRAAKAAWAARNQDQY